jgi:hypothetical protein
MSRMNAAWSSEPPWAEAVPAIFKEPMTIAFGGAILAHAIFFLGLPVVAGSEKQPDVQPVGTTILTDKEKAEIPPDLSQSQFSPGTMMPGTTSGLTIPLIPAAPSTAGNIATSPGTGFSFGQPSEPTFSSGGYSTGSSSSDNSDFNARLAEITKKQEEARKEEKKKAEIAKKQEADKVDDKKRADNPPAPLPNVPVSAMPPGTPTGETPKQPESPSPANPPQQQPIRLSDKTLIDKDPALYALVTENTGPTLGVTLSQAIGTWYTRDPKTQEIYTRSDGKEQLELFPVNTITGTIPYPKQIGKQDVAVIPGYAEKVKAGSAKERMRAYGTAIVGIAVDGQGKRLIDPSIIQSTGHKILDDYAIEYVKSKIIFKITYKDEFYYMVIPIDPPVSTPAQQPVS